VALIGITRNCKLLQTTQFGKVIDSRVHCSKDRTRALEARLLLWHSYVFPVSEAETIVAKVESRMWKFTIATCTLFLQGHEADPGGSHRRVCRSPRSIIARHWPNQRIEQTEDS
jgi:hypothetical protein